MRSFNADATKRQHSSATPRYTTATASNERPQRAANPWRRSVKATGAFLLCFAIAGGIMLANTPTGAEPGNPSAPSQHTDANLDTSNAPDNPSADARSDTSAQANSASPAANSTGTSASSVTITSTTDTNSTRTALTVNGNDIPIPASGTAQQTVIDASGTTTVTVSQSSTGTEDSSSDSSTNTSVNLTGGTFSAESHISQTYSSGGGAY